MTDIVIVGGGTGGTVLANRLVEDLEREVAAGEVEVTLINDSPDHVYKPTFLYVPFGKKTANDAVRPLADLVDRRVNLEINRVVGIDTENKTLDLQDGGDTLSYDYLVVATGAKLVPEEVPGLMEGGHHFYGAEGAEQLRDALADFEEGHLVLSVVGVPHMCPAAPVEFVLMADEWFRERGIRDQVEITYTYPIMRLHGLQPVSDWMEPRFADRDINTVTFFNAEEVDPENKVIRSMEGEELDYDLLVAIPPHSGDDLIADSGLGDDGWVAVDKHTLEAEHAEDVFAMGDAADVPTSKAGSVAHYEADVIADRIASKVRGQLPTATFDGKTVCFIEAGMNEATFVEFDFENPPELRDESRPVHWAKLAYNESYWLTARGLL
ncbi:NAD(P)/FAD-dependent oxidoreductase [Haloarchaeobius sp. HME9146]|uniref:NAD(P)/FAD-dependent oxidoreductase n=1 Tax=Haloarchaeobius sp. HME9146 TaxID=2978732 RepID=UPI0021BEE8B6|nr:FAD/NAD(P)-binding oxidoreductase [Haloarchaeobius sp. HME9146]MCT9094987.1 NAD(P)/FAD-dependent oxidoreductase [Haloarchaeobius sp. HME9146]